MVGVAEAFGVADGSPAARGVGVDVAVRMVVGVGEPAVGLCVGEGVRVIARVAEGVDE